MDNNNDFWLAFHEDLPETYNRNTARIRLFYAKKFYQALLEDNRSMQDFLTIESGEKRWNVMKSLTALSKYLGCYDKWQELRRHFNMK